MTIVNDDTKRSDLTIGQFRVTITIMPITYLIHDRITGTRKVLGYAIDSRIGVRLAAHKVSDGELGAGGWRLDDYDTGYFIGPTYESFHDCVANGIAKVRQALLSGKYDKAVNKVLRKKK